MWTILLNVLFNQGTTGKFHWKQKQNKKEDWTIPLCGIEQLREQKRFVREKNDVFILPLFFVSFFSSS